MRSSGRRQPLVAVLCSVPLLFEAISSTLQDIAEVHAFPARRADTVGLLRSVRPDAVVVDDPIEAAEVESWAEKHDVPLLEICLRELKIRVLQDGDWEESAGASAESIRNAIAGSLYARGVVGS